MLARWLVLKNNRKGSTALKNAAELIAAYERERGKNCRKYRCRYIQLNGNLGDVPVRTRYGSESLPVSNAFFVF